MDRLTVRGNHTNALNLRGEICTIVAESRPNTGSGNCATYGTAHQIMSACQLEAVLCKLCCQITNTHSCLHGCRTGIGIDVSDLRECGNIYNRSGRGRRTVRGGAVGADRAKRCSIARTGIERITYFPYFDGV